MSRSPYLIALIFSLVAVVAAPADEAARLAELDAYWAEVSRSVGSGDFGAYVATCHPKGVLISGSKEKCYPLSQALARWEQDFIDTREGKVEVRVEFRFSRRLGDATTAHETGMFAYTSQKPGEEPKTDYVHLVALLLKEEARWQIVMEQQESVGTKEEWEALE